VIEIECEYFYIFSKKGDLMKKCLMEMLGVFLLTIAVSFTGNPIAIGLMLCAIVYVGGHVSGGHYIPAVSLASWMTGGINTKTLLMYSAKQTVGALAALLLFQRITGTPFLPGMMPEVELWISVLMEGLLTALFCWVILTVTRLDRFKNHVVYGVAIGLALMAIAFIGGLFNPAIALASLICNMVGGSAVPVPVFNLVAINVVAPLLGGALGALAFQFFNPKPYSM
jgi:aquaporin Z